MWWKEKLFCFCFCFWLSGYGILGTCSWHISEPIRHRSMIIDISNCCFLFLSRIWWQHRKTHFSSLWIINLRRLQDKTIYTGEHSQPPILMFLINIYKCMLKHTWKTLMAYIGNQGLINKVIQLEIDFIIGWMKTYNVALLKYCIVMQIY